MMLKFRSKKATINFLAQRDGICTTWELKRVAKKFGWEILSESYDSLVFLLKDGHTFVVSFNLDNQLTNFCDASNSTGKIPYTYDNNEEDEE